MVGMKMKLTGAGTTIDADDGDYEEWYYEPDEVYYDESGEWCYDEDG